MILWLVACRQVEPPVLQEIPDRFALVQIQAEPLRKRDAAGGAENSELLEKVLGTTGEADLDDGFGAAAPAEPARPDAPSPSEALRTWFPEAFLWRPSLRTDADGLASVDVKVPDTLTTWRVLALAHDDAGHQSGGLHTFESTLPAYLDPVVPDRLYVGDSLLLPVQVVENAGTPRSGRLAVELDGAVDGGLAQAVSVDAWGSTTVLVPLRAVAAGQGSLGAVLPGVDRVRESFGVLPTGRPVVLQQGGTLVGERTLDLVWPEGTDLRTARIAVDVQPGPLAVVQDELLRIDAGGSWTDAYAYQLLASAQRLAEATGASLEASTLRRVEKRAWQRLVRRARRPTVPDATRMLVGLASADGLAATLRTRLTRQVLQAQRPDGTWSDQADATLQRVLVDTAATARALQNPGARLRASGALERFAPNIDDPFTASVVVASGLIEPSEPLLAVLRSGLVPLDAPSGPTTVFAPSDVARPFGGRPTDADARAWMALALLRLDEPQLAGDLASQLLASPPSAVRLQALEAALPTASTVVPLSLRVDGDEVANATVDPARPGLTARLEGAPTASTTRVVLRGDAGLTYTLTQRAWVPWTGDEALPGVDLELTQEELVAGRTGHLDLSVAAPSGAEVRLVIPLPSGATVPDAASVRDRPGVAAFSVDTDRVELQLQPFGAGEVRTLSIPVLPRYAGTMRTGPLQLSSGDARVDLPPHVWRVR